MRTRTVVEKIGEYLGPVDWSYNFDQHFETCGGMRDKAAYIAQKLDWLRKLADDPTKYEATTDGGSPKFGWHDVVAVGMYDGWPYWRPVPSVCLYGTLGTEWHSFDSITGIAERKGGAR